MRDKFFKIDNVNGQVVYKDEDGWKFYCWTKDIEIEILRGDENLSLDMPELTLEEYKEITAESI